jgi:hypothetical protein
MQAQAAAEYAITTGAIGTLGAKAASTLGGATKQATQTGQKGIPQPTVQKNVPKPTPPNLDANRKAVAEKAIKSGVSTVQIDSTPSGALISVDNIALAHTPASLTLSKGIHVIELRHDGYISWQKAVLLAGDEKLSLNPALKDPKTSSPIFTVQR